MGTEVVEAVNNLTLSNSLEDNLDLVVLGGGAWDKLWKYDTEEDKESLNSALGELKTGITKLKKLKVPVVWLTPTSVNTAALPTEEIYLSQGVHTVTRYVCRSRNISSSY